MRGSYHTNKDKYDRNFFTEKQKAPTHFYWNKLGITELIIFELISVKYFILLKYHLKVFLKDFPVDFYALAITV